MNVFATESDLKEFISFVNRINRLVTDLESKLLEFNESHNQAGKLATMWRQCCQVSDERVRLNASRKMAKDFQDLTKTYRTVYKSYVHRETHRQTNRFRLG